MPNPAPQFNGQPLDNSTRGRSGFEAFNQRQDLMDGGDSLKLQVRLRGVETELLHEQKRSRLIYEENEKFRRQLSALEKKLSEQIMNEGDSKGPNKELIEAHRTEMESLRQENKTLNQKLEAATAKLSIHEYNSQRREIGDLRKNNDDLQVVIKQLSHELEERNEGITDLERQVEMYRRLSEKKNQESGEPQGMMDRVLFECSRCKQVFREFPKFQMHITHCLEYRLFNSTSRSERNLSTQSHGNSLAFNSSLGGDSQPVSMRYSYDNLRSTGVSHLRISALGKSVGSSADNSLASTHDVNFPERRHRTISSPQLPFNIEPGSKVQVTSKEGLPEAAEVTKPITPEPPSPTRPSVTVEKKETPKMQSAEKFTISPSSEPSDKPDAVDSPRTVSFSKKSSTPVSETPKNPPKRIEIPRLPPPPPPPPAEEEVIAINRPSTLNTAPPDTRHSFDRHDKREFQNARSFQPPESTKVMSPKTAGSQITNTNQESLRRNFFENISKPSPQLQQRYDAAEYDKKPLEDTPKESRNIFDRQTQQLKPILKPPSPLPLHPPSPILPQEDESIPGKEAPATFEFQFGNKPPSPIMSGSPIPSSPPKPVAPQIKAPLMPQNSRLSSQYSAMKGHESDAPQFSNFPPNHSAPKQYQQSASKVNKDHPDSKIQRAPERPNLRKELENSTKMNERPPGLAEQYKRQPNPTNQIHGPPGLTNQFERPPGRTNQFERPAGPVNQFDRQSGFTNQLERPPGPTNQFERPAGSTNQIDRPFGPTNQFQRPPQPNSHDQRSADPVNQFQRSHDNVNRPPDSFQRSAPANVHKGPATPKEGSHRGTHATPSQHSQRSPPKPHTPKEDQKQSKASHIMNPFGKKDSKEKEKKEKPSKQQPVKTKHPEVTNLPIKPVATSTAERTNKSQHLKQQQPAMQQSFNGSFSSLSGGGYYRKAPRPQSLPPTQNRPSAATVMSDV